jgi:hypothetical protein
MSFREPLYHQSLFNFDSNRQSGIQFAMRQSTRVDSFNLGSDVQGDEWRALLSANDLYRLEFEGMIEKYEFKAYGVFLLQERMLAEYSGNNPLS